MEILRRLRSTVPRAVLGAWALLGPLGCLDGPTPLSSHPYPGAAVSTSDASGPVRTSHSTTEAADETGTAGTSTGSDPTGVIFLIAPDLGPALQCNLLAQDCPPGEKCTSWANNGGSDWNATKCVPVVDDPAAVGEPCHVEGSGTSGIDDCDYGSMCFFVAPGTMEGICTPLCTGNDSNPQCPPDRYCTISASSALLLCLPMCNPLEQSCVAGQVCIPIQAAWDCASGALGAHGDPCEYPNQCDPGLVCLGSAVPPGEACDGASGCCTELCDLSDPLGDLQCAGAGGGQQCVPWYQPGAVPPGYENLGVCTL